MGEQIQNMHIYYHSKILTISKHALDVLHLERDWTVYLLCLVKLFVVFILLQFGE